MLQDASPGFMLCSPDNLCHTAKVFDAQVSYSLLAFHVIKSTANLIWPQLLSFDIG